MAKIQIVTTPGELAAMLERSHEAPVLYKHSVTCPISARAQEQFVQFESPATRYTLVVQVAHEASEAAARKLGVEHATPQVIGIEGGAARFSLSYDDVTVEALRDEVGA